MANQFYGGYPGINPAQAPSNWNQPVMYPIANNQFNQSQIQPPPPPQVPQQQMQSIPQRSYISGRVINPGEKIMANEVPGDGSVSIFPLSDRSKILVKEVNENGIIDTTTYIRASEDSKQMPESNDILPTILERLDNIEKMVKKNSSYYHRKKPAKKEGDVNE